MNLEEYQTVLNALRTSQEVFKKFYTSPNPLVTKAEKSIRMEIIRIQMKNFTNSLGPR